MRRMRERFITNTVDMPLSARLRILFNREARLKYTVPEFAHQNKGLLIIVCDPKTDRIFVTYKDKFVNGKIKAVTGRRSHVVKEVLKYSRFNESIDGYITAIMETLHLPIWRANKFYQFLDGAVYSISKSLRKGAAKGAAPTGPGLVKSPIQPEQIEVE